MLRCATHLAEAGGCPSGPRIHYLCSTFDFSDRYGLPTQGDRAHVFSSACTERARFYAGSNGAEHAGLQVTLQRIRRRVAYHLQGAGAERNSMPPARRAPGLASFFQAVGRIITDAPSLQHPARAKQGVAIAYHSTDIVSQVISCSQPQQARDVIGSAALRKTDLISTVGAHVTVAVLSASAIALP